LPVNTTGQTVHAGETLLEVYSPELIAAQQEYLLAARVAESTAPGAIFGRGETHQPERWCPERLRFWDIPEGELQRLVRQGEVRRRLPLTARAMVW
jgi:Cu(I)/Ag(I) efflux system membrane fusion protein